LKLNNLWSICDPYTAPLSAEKRKLKFQFKLFVCNWTGRGELQ
jgi:hypothetical protein